MRPRVPAALKLSRGNPGKRRVHAEAHPAQPREIPAPPAYLDSLAAAIWQELARQLVPLGLLTPIDLVQFEAYCGAASLLRLADDAIRRYGCTVETEDGTQRASPWIGIRSRAFAEVRMLGQQFGLTPGGRNGLAIKIAAATAKSEDDKAKYFARA